MSRDIDRHKKAKHDWYVKNKELTSQRTANTRQKRKKAIQELKESIPCTDCGIYYPYYVTHFDHLDASLKVSNISYLLATASMEAVMEEIEKCELVCANCHAFRGAKRRAEELNS